jgi:hypothetical protein
MTAHDPRRSSKYSSTPNSIGGVGCCSALLVAVAVVVVVAVANAASGPGCVRLQAAAVTNHRLFRKVTAGASGREQESRRAQDRASRETESLNALSH